MLSTEEPVSDATSYSVNKTNAWEYINTTDWYSVIQVVNKAISGIGVPGNLFVILVISCTVKLRKKIFNKFLLSQSAFDMGACAVLFIRQVMKLALSIKTNVNSSSLVT